MTTAAASVYLSLCEDTILQLLQAGTLRRVQLPGLGGRLRRVLVDRVDLDRLIEQGKT